MASIRRRGGLKCALFCVFLCVFGVSCAGVPRSAWVVNGQMSRCASTHSRHTDALEAWTIGVRECNLFKRDILMLSFGMARASASH